MSSLKIDPVAKSVIGSVDAAPIPSVWLYENPAELDDKRAERDFF